jgi:hypothetical protein
MRKRPAKEEPAASGIPTANQSFFTQITNLTLLATDTQQAILAPSTIRDGQDFTTERDLRCIVAQPDCESAKAYLEQPFRPRDLPQALFFIP